MSNRFVKTNPFRVWFRQLMPFVATLVILAVFYTAVSSLSATATSEQKKNLETTLRRGIMQCYALEGCYPESLEYLLENYPIYYNKDAFFIDYQIIGQNIYPSVSVIPKR